MPASLVSTALIYGKNFLRNQNLFVQSVEESLEKFLVNWESVSKEPDSIEPILGSQIPKALRGQLPNLLTNPSVEACLL